MEYTAWIMCGDYDRLSALSKKWRMTIQQTLEKVLFEHYRGDAGKVRQLVLTKGRDIKLSEKGGKMLKELCAYYDSQTPHVLHYVLESMGSD